MQSTDKILIHILIFGISSSKGKLIYNFFTILFPLIQQRFYRQKQQQNKIPPRHFPLRRYDGIAIPVSRRYMVCQIS